MCLTTGSTPPASRPSAAARPSRAEKRRDYHEWMDAKAEAREELWTDRESGHWTDPGQE